MQDTNAAPRRRRRRRKKMTMVNEIILEEDPRAEALAEHQAQVLVKVTECLAAKNASKPDSSEPDLAQTVGSPALPASSSRGPS